jgi:hypothetical protein
MQISAVILIAVPALLVAGIGLWFYRSGRREKVLSPREEEKRGP